MQVTPIFLQVTPTGEPILTSNRKVARLREQKTKTITQMCYGFGFIKL